MTQECLEKLATSALGGKVVSLKLAGGCFFGGEKWVPLDFEKVKFPELRVLEIDGEGIKTIYFTVDNCPKLERLSVVDPWNRGVEGFYVVLPLLREVVLDFVTIDDSSHFAYSLSRCPKLRSFVSHKLWGVGGGDGDEDLLVLPKCRYLRFSRADSLEVLRVWAPRIKNIELLCDYNLDYAEIVDEIPQTLQKELNGKEYESQRERGSKYKLEICNADIKEGNIASHERRIPETSNMTVDEIVDGMEGDSPAQMRFKRILKEVMKKQELL